MNLRARPLLVVALVLAVLAVPLVVALVVLHDPHWNPILDLAWTEMRVRDVASSDPPLIGLVGRIGPLGRQGSHPGPLSFYSLWPFYQLFGAHSWGMEAASASLHLVAMAGALWIAYRRGGLALVLAVGAVLAILARAYGAEILTQAWNPYMPVLFFFTFVLAAWSLVCDDLAVLPFGVYAGSFCAQTHVPYLGQTLGLGLFAVGVVVVRAYRRRTDRRHLRHVARWLVIGGAVAFVVWLPPVINQFTASRGNLSVLWDYFRNPPESPLGLHDGASVLLAHLNPWRVVAAQLASEQAFTGQTEATSGSIIPGLLVLGAWLGAFLLAWRARLRPLLELHVVLGVALALALVSLSRIFGLVWFYLVLWAWGLGVLVAFATAWTFWEVGKRRLAEPRRAAVGRAGVAALGATVLAFSTVFAFEASSADVPAPRLSETLNDLVPPTVEAIDNSSVDDVGPDEHFLVTWCDPVNIDAQGYALMNELERAGFDVKTFEIYGPAVTTHRVIDLDDATAVVHLAIGPVDVEQWDDKPGAERVAFDDPTTREEREEYERLRARVLAEIETVALDRRARDELARGVDENVFGTSLDPRLPRATRDELARMAEIDLASAVYVAPVNSATTVVRCMPRRA